MIERDGLLASDRRDTLVAYLTEHQDQVGLSAITVLGRNRGEIAHVKDPVIGDLPLREVGESQLRHGLAGQETTAVRELTSGDLIEAVAPVWSTRDGQRAVAAVVVVGTHVTERLETKVRAISQAFKDYKQLRLMKNPIKGSYILLFLEGISLADIAPDPDRALPDHAGHDEKGAGMSDTNLVTVH